MSTVTVTYDGPDTISRQLLEALANSTNNFTVIAAKLAAADGDKDKAIQAYIETSDDPAVVKLREQIKTATERLNKLATENAVTETLSDEEKGKLNTELDTLKGKIRSGRQAILTVADSMGVDLDGVKAALEAMPDPTRSNRGRKPGTAGSSLPRVSVNIEMTSDQDTEKVYTFDALSKAATHINAEVKDLQLAFAAAAGVKHEDIKTVDTPQSFTFQVEGEKDTWTIKTTPKERAKPGPRAATDKTAA